MKNEHISPKLVNSISLTPGWSGLERGITQGKFCAPHRTLVKILCKLSENFVEGAVINYKVILSLGMRLQIVANHPLSLGLSSLWYLGFTLLCNLVSVLILFLHDTLMLYVQSNYWRKFGLTIGNKIIWLGNYWTMLLIRLCTFNASLSTFKSVVIRRLARWKSF